MRPGTGSRKAPRSPQMSKARRQGAPKPPAHHPTLNLMAFTLPWQLPQEQAPRSPQTLAGRCQSSGELSEQQRAPPGSALLGGRGGGTESWEALKDQTQPSRSRFDAAAQNGAEESRGVCGEELPPQKGRSLRGRPEDEAQAGSGQPVRSAWGQTPVQATHKMRDRERITHAQMCKTPARARPDPQRHRAEKCRPLLRWVPGEARMW